MKRNRHAVIASLVLSLIIVGCDDRTDNPDGPSAGDSADSLAECEDGDSDCSLPVTIVAADETQNIGLEGREICLLYVSPEPDVVIALSEDHADCLSARLYGGAPGSKLLLEEVDLFHLDDSDLQRYEDVRLPKEIASQRVIFTEQFFISVPGALTPCLFGDASDELDKKISATEVVVDETLTIDASNVGRVEEDMAQKVVAAGSHLSGSELGAIGDALSASETGAIEVETFHFVGDPIRRSRGFDGPSLERRFYWIKLRIDGAERGVFFEQGEDVTRFTADGEMIAPLAESGPDGFDGCKVAPIEPDEGPV
jgi:hypothetical protein